MGRSEILPPTKAEMKAIMAEPDKATRLVVYMNEHGITAEQAESMTIVEQDAVTTAAGLDLRYVGRAWSRALEVLRFTERRAS